MLFKNNKINSRDVDILLIQCPPWDIYMPPLEIAYLSSYLKKCGYAVETLDLNILLYNKAGYETKKLWEQISYNFWAQENLFQDTISKIRHHTEYYLEDIFNKVNTKYIGLSVNFASIQFASEVIKKINSLNDKAKVILGGWGCITQQMRNLYPKGLIDVFVIGEGEYSLKEVIDSFEGKINEAEVTGVIFNKKESLAYKPRLPQMNLDEIPWPTYKEFSLDKYKNKELPLFTSRGCIGACTFCNDWNMCKPYRCRSANNIFNEIKYHVENNGIHRFGFKDLLCNGNIKELNLLCDLLINSNLNISWDSQAISRKEMTYELLCKLRKSGCETLTYGIESFSNNVLKRMKKIFTKEIAERVLKDTYNAGIKSMVNIIVGFPGENESNFEETVEAIKRNQKYIFQVSAISVCLVNNDSDLEINPNNYELVLSEDPRVRPKEWIIKDGTNNYKIRRIRADKIIKLVNDLGLSYATTTI